MYSVVPYRAGAMTAIAAFAVNVSVENIAGFKFWATLSLLEKGYVGGSFLVRWAHDHARFVFFCAAHMSESAREELSLSI